MSELTLIAVSPPVYPCAGLFQWRKWAYRQAIDQGFTHVEWTTTKDQHGETVFELRGLKDTAVDTPPSSG